MKIKDILTIDLSEDIKNVIDLEDISEKEIQNEIENYIVTDGLAKKYSDFATTYTSNILETGVWISGFYGSGKSYFGKLVGYMLSNRMIAGTPARERIIQRFTGIAEEALVKNTLLRLDAVKSRVVFLDIAKQNTSKGFAFTLFRNFLRTLDLPENEHGFFLYQLMLNEGDTDIHRFISGNLDRNWTEIRSRMVEYAKASKELFLRKGNSDSDYDNLMTTIRRDIDQFSAGRLKVELENYLEVKNDEKIVFLFDEASEAINQKKFTLLDLEGISESLSSLGGKVWTIAIAQEKLDDVISNSNINKAQLTKVTDRFKTKIHLEATEVDVIIRNRLLKKSDEGEQLLTSHFIKNSGKISDHAAIHGAGVSKTESAEGYTTYYPFYKYQFDLLQNFLFGTKGYASTKVAARGMIITTYDILKQEVQQSELFRTVTGWHIAKEGQPQPPVRLVSRYDNAERILREARSPISGRKLLETINFLSEAEVTPATLPNIVKSYISDPDDYHKILDDLKNALERLIEAKILLDANKTYRITSDVEQRLLDEMNNFTVQGFVKKKQMVTAFKETGFLQSISRLSDSGLQYDFYITTDNDDELTNPAQKYLKVKITSIYNISDNRTADIDTLKVQHQDEKDLLWLVPENSGFKELDRLIDEVERITYLEQKYNNPASDEGKILTSFTAAKWDKKNRIKDLVEEALKNATAIYLYDTLQLSETNWQTTIQAQQRHLIQNVYTKRLSSQLSDNIASVVIKQAIGTQLHKLFHGNDFQFFDPQGNFVGENLKISEEILYRTSKTFVDGATLEKDLEQPPTGYTYGTVISSVAALMRAGKIIAKYNGVEKFSWRDEGVPGIFQTVKDFRKTSFKAVSKSLSALQRQELAQFLLDIEAYKYIDKKIDFNTNDFDLVNAIRDTAKHFADKVQTLRNSDKEFDKLFPLADDYTITFGNFTGAVSEANYIDKAVEFLPKRGDFQKATQYIQKVANFIRNNLPKVKEWKAFMEAVQDELKKAARNNTPIHQIKTDFDTHYKGDVIKNYSTLQQLVQKAKDEYHNLFSVAMIECSELYSRIDKLTVNLIAEIEALPQGLNDSSLKKARELKDYAHQRMRDTIHIDYDVNDKESRFSYSEVLSFIDLYTSKKTEVDILRSGLIRNVVLDPPAGPLQKKVKKIQVRVPVSGMKIADYKKWLHGELQKIATASDTDEVEIEL